MRTLPPSDQVTPERLLQFGFAYAAPLIIAAAVTNKVFDTLATGAKTAEQVSRATASSLRGLRSIMNIYSLAPESEAFLVTGKPGSLAGFFAMNTTRLIPLWMKLGETVRTGRPPEARNQEGTGSEFFQELVDNIIPMSHPSAQALGDALQVSAAKETVRVLDLAAGSGIWGIVLAQQSPHVQVTAVDWSGVIPITQRITQRFGVGDRFTFVEGDLLNVDFGSGYDIATLGHILHSEGEKRSRQLLQKTFGALQSEEQSPSRNGS